jgi:cytochrome b6-f complex iron-sulfur subunit
MKEKARKISRRVFFEISGKIAVIMALMIQAFGAIKAFLPQVLYEPPSRFKIGKPDDFSDGITFLSQYKLYIFRKDNDFHVVSAICTHLDCVADWKPDEKEFYCSCHGSIFSEAGTILKGPAPRSLYWHPLALSPDGNLVVETDKQVSNEYKFSL